MYDICITYARVVGIKAPESLCHLLMYINPTLNKDYLLTYLLNGYVFSTLISKKEV